jgi:hypothetical protein
VKRHAPASLSRRRFTQALVTFALTTANTRAGTPSPKASGRTAPTLNVKDFGAFGNGRMSDLQQIRAAVARAGEYSAGATVLFPAGDYFLGAADEAYKLVWANKLQNVRFVGERATISCRSVSGVSNMLVLDGCRNVAIEGLTFRDDGLKREINWLGAAAIRLANDSGVGCENIQISDCTFDSVLGALVCRETDPALRSRGVRLASVTISRSYYGINFQHNGDDVTARDLRCRDVKRSYFPYGVSDHDIELEAIANETGFTDVLISCYRRSTSNIRVKLRSRGKRGGDAIVNLDHQNEVPNLAFRNIALDLDVDDVDCRLDTAILFRAMDQNKKIERTTTRRWEGISLDGEIRICDRTKLIELTSVSERPSTLRIGPRLARHPRLPSSFPGFNVEIART